MSIISQNTDKKKLFSLIGTTISGVKESERSDNLLDIINNPENKDLSLIGGLSLDFHTSLEEQFNYEQEEAFEISRKLRPAFAYDNFGEALYYASSVAKDTKELMFFTCMLYKHYILEDSLNFFESLIDSLEK